MYFQLICKKLTRRGAASRFWQIAILITLCPVCLASTLAQENNGSSDTKKFELDVVSVRPSNPQDQHPRFDITSDEIYERDNSLLWLIEVAYGLDEERNILGAPNWIKSEKYDIRAKVRELDIAQFSKLDNKERSHLLQAVLESRFGLKFHYEYRNLPNFQLVVANHGPKSRSPKRGI
jgi:uncharacterized protein (TIGR03435 family)